MKRGSDKGSKGAVEKIALAVDLDPGQKGNDAARAAEEMEASRQYDEDESEYDEEEQLVPALTSLSMENVDAASALDSETMKSVEAAMTKIHGSAHEGTGTLISSHIQKVIAVELNTHVRKGKVDLQSEPLKEYLEQTVIPIVHQGLIALSRERPASPIEYLAAYFLKHKHKYQNDRDLPMMYSMDQDKSPTNTSLAHDTPPGNVPHGIMVGTRESQQVDEPSTQKI